MLLQLMNISFSLMSFMWLQSSADTGFWIKEPPSVRVITVFFFNEAGFQDIQGYKYEPLFDNKINVYYEITKMIGDKKVGSNCFCSLCRAALLPPCMCCLVIDV